MPGILFPIIFPSDKALDGVICCDARLYGHLYLSDDYAQPNGIADVPEDTGDGRLAPINAPAAWAFHRRSRAMFHLVENYARKHPAFSSLKEIAF
jgi:hypothetical protein